MGSEAAAISEVVIVANRLPVSWSRAADGSRALTVSPGGLVSALAPVSERLNCTWVGWIDTDLPPDFALDGTRLVGVRTDPDLFDSYYLGFANQVLWPVFHGLPGFASPSPDDAWLSAYRAVNRAFAERIAEIADRDALVWVQDYHLLLVPAFLRALRPDLRIAVFLHIPFPDSGLLASQPWAGELADGLSHAHLVGVQRESDAQHMIAVFQRFAARTPPVRAFPISIDTTQALRNAGAADEHSAVDRMRAGFGATGRKLVLGVDRLDYTKGILERVAAFDALLGSWDSESTLPVLVHVLTPTRETIPAYREYRDRVVRATAEVNRTHGTPGYTPIVELTGPVTDAALSGLYLAADVMCVTPLRDGMNLVAKEFAAARIDERGVLLLGAEAGAADELLEAVVVDPASPASLVAGLLRALAMPADEAARRMRALRARVLGRDVHAWARKFIEAAHPSASS